MAKSPHSSALVFDPIPFKGGSKIATAVALGTCKVDAKRFVVATVDPTFWRNSDFYRTHDVQVVRLWIPGSLLKQHNGARYWLCQLWFMLALAMICLTTRQLKQVVGASGPGLDMPLYLLKPCFRFEVIQFIHGNVGLSRSIGYCLTRADSVHYLPSTKASLNQALSCYLQSAVGQQEVNALSECYLSGERYVEFVNGLQESHWPSACQHKTPVCFWAASLLKWKGLDLFVQALKTAHQRTRFATHICYLIPTSTTLPVSRAPVLLKHTEWHHDPDNLDTLRRESNIFVSTSVNEPFGLSILEALAAGMCVILPQDGSYWDQVLSDGEHCIKYPAGDTEALTHAIEQAVTKKALFSTCCEGAQRIAKRYTATQCYQAFANALSAA